MPLLPKYLDTDNEFTTQTTEFFPSHFMVKIESFSSWSESDIDKYECSVFEAGGHKWKLVIYPNGKDSGTDQDNISIDISVADPSSLSISWETNAIFGIFIHNQLADNFFCMRGKARRFHALAPSCGFSKFISKKRLIDPSNGFLVDDVCIFGAEVFVLKKPDIIERLSFTKAAKLFVRSLTIPNYSCIKGAWRSKDFTAGDQTWNVTLWPEGFNQVYCITVLIRAVENPCLKVKADVTVRIKDQTGNNHHMKRTVSGPWFDKEGLGWELYTPISDMKDPTKGFVVKDCCILEVEISALVVARTSP